MEKSGLMKRSALVKNLRLVILTAFALNLTIACAPKTTSQAPAPSADAKDRAVAAVTTTTEEKADEKAECEGSTSEESECIAVHLGLAEAELKVLFESLQKRLTDDSKSRDTLTRITAIEVGKRLERAQKSWVQFRQNDCSLESAEMLGGNREDLSFNSCLLERTRERIRVLKELAI